jgi:hypothetical protein
MANNYQLRINYAEAHRELNGYQKVVYRIQYDYLVVNENGFRANLVRFVDLPDFDPENFIPFDDLDRDQVSQWVLSLVDEEVLKIEVDEVLENIINPPTMILEFKH